jgi:hypothetical protein
MDKKRISPKTNSERTLRKKVSAVAKERAIRAPEIKPRWDGEDRILWWNGIVVIEFGRKAPSLELFLATFQELGWKRKVPNPFTGPHKKAHQALRNAIKKLNGRQNVIRFHGDGDGEHVRWEVVAESRPG